MSVSNVRIVCFLFLCNKCYLKKKKKKCLKLPWLTPISRNPWFLPYQWLKRNVLRHVSCLHGYKFSLQQIISVREFPIKQPGLFWLKQKWSNTELSRLLSTDSSCLFNNTIAPSVCVSWGNVLNLKLRVVHLKDPKRKHGSDNTDRK